MTTNVFQPNRRAGFSLHVFKLGSETTCRLKAARRWVLIALISRHRDLCIPTFVQAMIPLPFGGRIMTTHFRTLLAMILLTTVGCTMNDLTQSNHPTRAGSSLMYDVKTFGATGDGKTLDTQAVNKAIDAASAAGGGTVVFPAGTYLCYSIHLKSNICLWLDQAATIVAAENPMDPNAAGYDAPEPNEWDPYEDFGHSHWHNSLIWAVTVIG
jgi:hypothetical protein